MDLRKLKKLIDLVQESGIAELEITEGEEKVKIVKGGAVSITPAAAARRISTESADRPCRKSTISKSLASVSAKRTKARASTASRATGSSESL